MFQDIYACVQMAQHEVAVRTNQRHQQFITDAEAIRSMERRGIQTNLLSALRNWATSFRGRVRAPQS